MDQRDVLPARGTAPARWLFATVLAVLSVFAVRPVQTHAAEPSTLFAAATGVIESGPATPVWHAAGLDLAQNEPFDDPAAGVPGFLVVVEGTVLVENGATGRRTFVAGNGALFLAADDAVAATALGDDASAWRIAVVTDGSDSPFVRGDVVERPFSVAGQGDEDATEGAIRRVEVRVGQLFDGDEIEVGGDDETVPLVCTLFNSVVPGDDETIREGRCRATPDPDIEGPALLFADDGDAVVGAVVVGAALDPENLASEREDDQANEDEGDDESASTSTSGASNSGGTSSGGATSDGNGPDDAGGDGDAGGEDGDGDDGGGGGGGDQGGGGEDGGEDGGGEEGDGAGDDGDAPDLTDLDTDGDGLNDQFELDRGTNLNSPDTDGDGLTDRQELIELGLNTDPISADTDRDRLTDGEEVNGTLGFVTRPDNWDSEGDGLKDGDEVLSIGTNPWAFDTDGDGISDGTEVAAGCSPLLTDTDGDGLSDATIGEECI